MVYGSGRSASNALNLVGVPQQFQRASVRAPDNANTFASVPLRRICSYFHVTVS